MLRFYPRKIAKFFYQNYRRKYKRFVQRKCPPTEKAFIDGLKTGYTDMVQKEKDKYLKSLGSIVSDPSSGQKKYWTALKKLLNNSGTSVIPPILQDGVFITDIKEKCNLFNVRAFFEN